MSAKQIDIFSVPKEFDGYDGHSLAAFKQYHKERPEVYREFVRFTKQMIAVGRYHYGAKGVMERVRWHEAMEYSNSTFKISNNFTALYARLFAYYHPQYRDFFSYRQPKGITSAGFEKEDL